jgi:hypothetical protein
MSRKKRDVCLREGRTENSKQMKKKKKDIYSSCKWVWYKGYQYQGGGIISLVVQYIQDRRMYVTEH